MTQKALKKPADSSKTGATKSSKNSRKPKSSSTKAPLTLKGHPALVTVASKALYALRPPPRLKVSEWADEYRYLSRETAAEPGKWHTDRVNFMREPMDAFSDPAVTRVVAMMGAQISKSESLICNIAGYFMHQDPAPILIVQPREHDAKQFSKNRIASMIRDSPALKASVQAPKTRDSNNTILEKNFPGGRLICAGSNSPQNLAGNPCRVVLMDEVDRFAESSGTEGSPIELAEARTSTFSNRCIGLTSTPTMADASFIEKAYNDSDMRQFWVPCFSCGGFQVLKWKQVKWDKDENGHQDPSTARYHCEHCDERWTEAQKHKSVREGEWRALKPFKGTAGFWLSGLYAPWANMSLPNLVEKWLKAQGKPLMLRTFLNTILAETWKEKFEHVDETGLLGRAEKYPMHESGERLVPKGVTVLVAGVDTQDNRLEFLVQGFGSQEESWFLEHHVLPGDPGTQDLWMNLWEMMIAPRYSETGEEIFIRATSIDTGGHFTQQAYQFCGPRFRYQAPTGERCFTFAIKGQPGNGDVFPRKPSYKNLAKIPLFPIRVAPAKEVIYSRLNKISEPGPGYMHFHDGFEDAFYKQLTAERVVTKWDARGFPKRIWELKYDGARNEILDMSCYAYASLCGMEAMGFNLNRESEKRQIELEGYPLQESGEVSEPSPASAPSLGQAVPTPSPAGGAARIARPRERSGVRHSSYLRR